MYYIVSYRDFTLSNPDAPDVAPANEVAVTGVTLVHPGNVTAVLDRLARWHFSRARADVDVIDNGDYVPGDRVTAPLDDARSVTGIIERAEFAFGLQAKASLSLTAATVLGAAALRIRYLWEGTLLGQAVYELPVGYAYAIDNPFLDRTIGGHRYVFRPENDRAEGVVTAGGCVDEQAFSAALDLYEGILDIISVDGVSERAAGSYTWGVIA